MQEFGIHISILFIEMTKFHKNDHKCLLMSDQILKKQGNGIWEVFGIISVYVSA